MATDDDPAVGGTDEYGRILCLTGPESTGKTTLAEALAEHFNAPLVPEVARSYLAGRRGYDAADVLQIARMQAAEEAAVLAEGHPLVICDTDVLVIRVWWAERFGSTPAELAEIQVQAPERSYLLTRPDLPWEPDPLRENPDDRGRLFERYTAILGELAASYAIVEGVGAQRMVSALSAVKRLMPRLSA